MPESIKDPTSLENLHDIVAPGPVPWWPPAPGWYALGLLVLVAAILLLTRTARKWWNDRYRREALAELARLQPLGRDKDQTLVAMAQLAELLKRVALVAWPRETVAHLSGQPWLNFLNQTGPKNAFADDRANVLCDVTYCRKKSEQLSSAQVEQLFSAASDWINHHDSSTPFADDQWENIQ